jgi:uncharacterized protein YbbC (DUF1343 family)
VALPPKVVYRDHEQLRGRYHLTPSGHRCTIWPWLDPLAIRVSDRCPEVLARHDEVDTMVAVRPGISVLLDDRLELLRHRRIGILTGPSGVLPDMTRSVDQLLRVSDVHTIFAPEHGLLGAAVEGAKVSDSVYRGVPVYSLYGPHDSPTLEQLAPLDGMVVDFQDIGCRFYTYAWTLVKLMQAASTAAVTVIVTDRPNPIGGAVEGPGVEPPYCSLVGLHDVPIRHGLSLGELARLANAELDIQCDLRVVPCERWRRSARWQATGLLWAPSSPNMPTAETALLYPGTCLIEGVNLSVGRGTAKPFEWLGAPWIDGMALAEILNRMALPGLRWRPVAFQHCAGRQAGTVCQGIQPHVSDPDSLRAVLAGVGLLAALQQLHGDKLIWNEQHFDHLAGSSVLRAALSGGAQPVELATAWKPYEGAFRQRAAPFLLYTE